MWSSDVMIAFLSGASSVLGAGWSLKRARREERERCDERVEEIREIFGTGFETGLMLKERE